MHALSPRILKSLGSEVHDHNMAPLSTSPFEVLLTFSTYLLKHCFRYFCLDFSLSYAKHRHGGHTTIKDFANWFWLKHTFIILAQIIEIVQSSDCPLSRRGLKTQRTRGWIKAGMKNLFPREEIKLWYILQFRTKTEPLIDNKIDGVWDRIYTSTCSGRIAPRSQFNFIPVLRLKKNYNCITW